MDKNRYNKMINVVKDEKISVNDLERKNDAKSQVIFHFVVSNPPYQRETGNGAVATYHFIMNIAKLVSKNISMIYPARWTNTGRGEGIAEFRDTELNSTHYQTFIIYSGESDVFEDATIKGGVNYFHWSATETNNTKYFYNDHEQDRTTLLNGQNMMISDPRFSEIIAKVNTKQYFNVMSRNYYGPHLEADYNIERLAKSIDQDAEKINHSKGMKDNSTKIYYSGMGGGIRTIFIPKGSGKYDDSGYKVLVSRTADPDKKRGTLRRQNRIFIIEPGEICGGSFLQAGMYKKEQEAFNAVKYLRSIFGMFLLGAITPTQNTTKSNYYLLPDVDFSSGKILDNDCVIDFDSWIDDQLCKIYGISDDEFSFMRSVVKPWDDSISFFGCDLS